MRSTYILLCMLLLGAALAQAVEERNLNVGPAGARGRVALVIDNSACKDVPLKNPVNDARDMAAKLKELGFRVFLRKNLLQRQIGAALREFRGAIDIGDEVLFFYAGRRRRCALTIPIKLRLPRQETK